MNLIILKKLDYSNSPNNHVVPYNHVGWTISLNLIVMWSQLIMWGRFFPQSVKNPILLCIKSRNSKTITYYQTKINKTFVFWLHFTFTFVWELVDKTSIFNQHQQNFMLFEKFLEKLIIMWSLIRPCWVDFSSKLNRHVDMIIRAIRVW